MSQTGTIASTTTRKRTEEVAVKLAALAGAAGRAKISSSHNGFVPKPYSPSTNTSGVGKATAKGL
jgi:hypothetical protein